MNKPRREHARLLEDARFRIRYAQEGKSVFPGYPARPHEPIMARAFLEQAAKLRAQFEALP